jgi:hypothetical protein
MQMKAVNQEGLTLSEWHGAATRWNANALNGKTGRGPWSRGEDPTEYAAAAEKANQKMNARIAKRQSVAEKKDSLR